MPERRWKRIDPLVLCLVVLAGAIWSVVDEFMIFRAFAMPVTGIAGIGALVLLLLYALKEQWHMRQVRKHRAAEAMTALRASATRAQWAMRSLASGGEARSEAEMAALVLALRESHAAIAELELLAVADEQAIWTALEIRRLIFAATRFDERTGTWHPISPSSLLTSIESIDQALRKLA